MIIGLLIIMMLGVAGLVYKKKQYIQQLEMRLLEQHARHQETLAQLALLQKKIVHQKDTDTLTGLPNRQYLQEKLEEWITQHRTHHLVLAVMFFHLEGFDSIGQLLGYDTEELVTQEIA